MKKRTAGWKIIIPLVAGVLVIAAAFIAISYVTFREYEIEDLTNYARGLTNLISEERIIDGDRIGDYLEQGRAYPGYAEAERKLYRLRNAYPDVLYLYVYQVREDGYHVVFDLSTDEFKGSEPGEVQAFFPAFLPYIPDMLEGEEVPAVESREEYGHVLTVCTPLYNSKGECTAYVCADCSMEALGKYVRKVIGKLGLFFAAVLALMLALGILFTEHRVVRRMSRLENRAYNDTLTGLQNRTAYYEYNDVLNKKEDAGNADFSILMIDINWLKRVNDTYGHEQGNLYLQAAADLLRKVFGEEHLYRIGGDEFVQILEGKAQEGAEERIAAFREEIARLQADESLQPWEKVSAAVGMAKYEPGRDASTEEVLRRADEAMYREKIAMKAVRTN